MRMITLLTIILGLTFPNFSQETLTIDKIRQFLNSQDKIEIIKQKPDFELPFITLPEEVILVNWSSLLPHNSKSQTDLKIFFTLSGDLIRIESLQKMTISDPWRRTVKEYEEAIRHKELKINGIGKLSGDYTLEKILSQICKYYHLEEAKEFSISVLDYKFLFNKESINTIMVKAWGLENPMPVLQPLSSLQINRVRAFFNLKGCIPSCRIFIFSN